MYKNLVQAAHDEGIQDVVIDAVIQKEGGKILLIKEDAFYGFPSAQVKEEESVAQAIQRAVMERTAMGMKEVVRYVGHYDREGVRHLLFVVEVNDPYSLEEVTEVAYAWLEVQEAVGYPIQDEVREMLDLYKKGA